MYNAPLSSTLSLLMTLRGFCINSLTKSLVIKGTRGGIAPAAPLPAGMCLKQHQASAALEQPNAVGCSSTYHQSLQTRQFNSFAPNIYRTVPEGAAFESSPAQPFFWDCMSTSGRSNANVAATANLTLSMSAGGKKAAAQAQCLTFPSHDYNSKLC